MTRLNTKFIGVIGLVFLLIFMVAGGTLAAKPADSPWRTTPDNLPIIKMPWISGAKGGTPGPPPGKGKPEEPPAPEVNKWAVIVGIADYPGVDSDLWHSDDDALEMVDALISKYGFPEDNVKLLLNRKAKARDILQAIDWLADREDADSSVVFFFCGHGFRQPDTEGWDADSEDDGYDEGIVSWDMYGLPDGMLEERFSSIETNRFTLIFGSCFSGGMFDDDNDLQSIGRVITSGCEYYQYCWDYLYLGNTLFGYYFIDKGILNGLAVDIDGDGHISIEEAFEYAYNGVISHIPQPPDVQTPAVSDKYLTSPDYSENLLP